MSDNKDAATLTDNKVAATLTDNKFSETPTKTKVDIKNIVIAWFTAFGFTSLCFTLIDKVFLRRDACEESFEACEESFEACEECSKYFLEQGCKPKKFLCENCEDTIKGVKTIYF